ncbi:hypothetical protein EVA_10385 [gut metagenome]|uniref:Uncharacterized protein n=1 Tax=gut metagenome TaxID=749906 RepID=J9GHW6_9ZZZZ
MASCSLSFLDINSNSTSCQPVSWNTQVYNVSMLSTPSTLTMSPSSA